MIDDPFITLVLAPLLVPQGIYTRRVTPKLPEPEGGREGERGQGSILRVLIVGDSAAAGVGVSQQTEALSGHLVSDLASQRTVQWRVFAETGLKTEDLLERLKAHEAFETDIVITSLGVNDVTGGTRCKRWLQLQDELQCLLRDKFKAKHILLSSVPPMHEFPALPQPLRWFLGRRSKAFNQALEQQSLASSRTEFVKVQFPIQAEYFALDGFHPSADAYQLWSKLLLERIVELRAPIENTNSPYS